jgi:hypothetical protein
MNCAFEPADCPQLLKTYKCYRCQHCGKTVSLAADAQVDVSVLFSKFECPTLKAQAAPVPEPAPNTSHVMLEAPAPYVWDPSGPGTQLKKLLSKVGIKATENCSCNARAKLMNAHGVEWCEQHVDEIVGWLKEEAGKRKLPFLAWPTKILVQRAIKIAKRNRDRSAPEAEAADDAAD